MSLPDIPVVVSALLLGFFIRDFFPGYFRKKGENLATKEDIGEITQSQKAVEHRFNELIEESKQRHALRLAALDRRLAAHQEAFALWRRLLSEIKGETIATIVLECQDWWEKNCLYLEPGVRDAFFRAYSAAILHHSYVQAFAASDVIEENWKAISNFPNILFAAIKLPPIAQADVENVLPSIEKKDLGAPS